MLTISEVTFTHHGHYEDVKKACCLLITERVYINTHCFLGSLWHGRYRPPPSHSLNQGTRQVEWYQSACCRVVLMRKVNYEDDSLTRGGIEGTVFSDERIKEMSLLEKAELSC